MEEIELSDYKKMWLGLKEDLENAVGVFKMLAEKYSSYNDLVNACNCKRMLLEMEHMESMAKNLHFDEDERSSAEYVDALNHTHIEDLNFTRRTYNCLHRAGKNRVGDLLKMSYEDLFKIRNLGRHSANEIREKLKAIGLELRED